MSRLRARNSALIATMAAAALLGGCTRYEPLRLSGAASMRVESEVYKGPATLSVSAQIGQNAAVLADLVRALDTWLGEADAYYPQAAYFARDKDGICARYSVKDLPEIKDLTPCTVPDPWQSAARDTYADLPAEHDYAAPDSRGICLQRGTVTARMPLKGWQDCKQLEATIASARRAVIDICYIINTPAFASLRHVVSLPIATCEKSEYKAGWSFLLKPHPLADDLKDAGISSTDQEAQDGLSAYGSANILAAAKAWEHCDRLGKAATAAKEAKAQDQGTVYPSRTTELDFECFNEPIVMSMESLAAMLRASAMRAADATVRHIPRDRQFRGLIAEYAFIASEYGGQISARVNILQKALVDKKDMRTLPTSDFLRGAGITDFAHLIEWLDAGDRSYGLTFADYPDLASRVRMAERLNADASWEKFNEVHASGQGEVGMAFVKDELGNWNLKAFRNDPSQLLAAYRKVTDATLMAAAKLATKAASGGATDAAGKLASAGKAVTLANQLAGAQTPGAGAALDTGAMHAEVIATIEARRKALGQRYTQLSAELVEANTSGDTATAQKVQALIDDLPQRAAEEIDAILQSYQRRLTSAQEAIAASQSAPAQ